MLENEPTGGERVGENPSGDAAESTTPTRRVRAPRRKATPPPAEAATGEAATAEPGAAVEAAAVPEAAAEPPAAPVRRTRRKAVAPAAVPAAEAVASEADAAAPAAEPGAAPDAEVVPPVKATRVRRKKAAPEPVAEIVPDPVAEPLVAEEEAEEETATTPIVTTTPSATTAAVVGVLPLDDDFVPQEAPATRSRSRRAAALPPAVLFMPPEQEEAPAPRRGRRPAVVAPVIAPVDADEPVAEVVAEPAAEVTDEPAEGSRRRRRPRRGAEEPVEAVEVAEPLLDESDENADENAESADGELDDDDDDDSAAGRRRRRRGRRGRGRGKGPAEDGDDEDGPAEADAEAEAEGESDAEEDSEESEDGDGVTRRRRRRRRKGAGDTETGGTEDGVHTVVRIREPRTRERERSDEVQGVSGSTRLEAKRQRRRDGREQRRTRPPILSESEFLARREAVDRVMVVRQKSDRIQIAVLEDDVLVEHYVARSTSGTMVGNVYLGKVQNVLPSMEAAFIDVGRGRNAVLYAGEVNWDATGLEGRARSIETALRSGDSVLVQVTKDPIGHKGARLSSHIALSGRHLVYVPNGNASGISRKLPDNERKRLRDVLKKMVPDGAGVIVRTAAEGASEDELARDVKRLQAQWEDIQARSAEGTAPSALSEEPDLVIRVVRDLFNEDFRELIVQGEQAYGEVENYLNSVSPDLVERLHRHTGVGDVFAERRIDEQILKGLDRKVFLPSGGHLVIDRTEAMTVVDVNTGKYVGAGGNLEETVTRNNLEAAEEIVRQLRLRDIGGIVVIDFIDMVLESNRELVLRRLTECLGRDRTKHQVTEITSLGLVQMTRKRIGAGLLEAFTETCEHCKGRGLIIHSEPVPEKRVPGAGNQVKAVASAATRTESAPVQQPATGRGRRRRGGADAVESAAAEPGPTESVPVEPIPAEAVAPVPHGTSEAVAAVADLPSESVHTPAAAPRAAVAPAATAPAVSRPAQAGSGIVATAARAVTPAGDDDYDMSGYDLSRYESNGFGTTPDDDDDEDDQGIDSAVMDSEGLDAEVADTEETEPLQLTGADDPDAADDEDGEDEPVGAGAGARRRSRRGGTRRRTRP
jgi:ribonuclease E